MDVGGDGEVALAVSDGRADQGDALDRRDVDAVREVVVEERHDRVGGEGLDDVVKKRQVDCTHVGPLKQRTNEGISMMQAHLVRRRTATVMGELR